VRCLEQVRNDVCYLKANVKIVAVGGGLGYGAHGMSHHATEDLAILRALPNLVVLAPADLAEAEGAARAMMAYEGPVYYRCGLKKEPPLHTGPIDFKIGRALQVCEGSDATVIFTGTIGTQVNAAVKELANQGIQCRLVSMHTVKPIDPDAILAAARETGAVITVEEHNLQGGLGSAVAEVLMDAGAYPKKFLRLGLPNTFVSKIGSREWLLDQYGLSPAKIAASIQGVLKG
jgi:transketolase